MIAIAQITDLRASFAVGHREKAHQDVRQSRGAEHERHAERDLVDRRLEVETRLEEALAELVRRHRPRCVAEQQCDLSLHLGVADDGVRNDGKQKPYGTHTNIDEDDRRRDEQNRLDDLHPCRRDHAAEQHVAEHQHTDDDHGNLVVDADQRLHQHATADHLRRQVERRHGDDRKRADDRASRADCSDRRGYRPACTCRCCGTAPRSRAAR